MTLFQRLINKSTGRAKSQKLAAKAKFDIDRNEEFCCSPLPFCKDQLRLVVYLQQRDRRLLFDSSTVRPRRVSESSTSSDPDYSTQQKVFLTPDGKFECYPVLPDTKFLEEMIFGSTAMAYKGQVTKVHQNDNPDQIVLSRVVACARNTLTRSSTSYAVSFCGSRVSSSESGSDSQYSSVSSRDAFTRLDLPGRSIPMDVPAEIQKTSSLHRNHGGPRTPKNTPERPSSANSTSSPRASGGSLSRSWRIKLAKQNRKENLSFCEEEPEQTDSSRLIGLGLVVEKGEPQCTQSFEHFRKFLFTHMHLIDGGLDHLQDSLQYAYANRKKRAGGMLYNIHQAWLQFEICLMQMYMAPRLREPVWLDLMISNGINQPLSFKFGKVFSALADITDTKNTNFFLSTLLTAILTHHVSWVASVAPCSTPTQPVPPTPHPDWHTHTLPVIDQPSCPISDLPYNPYWAQYNDVTGVLSAPLRQAKTVLIGTDPQMISQLLFILSYFIRCSSLKESAQVINPEIINARFANEDRSEFSRSPPAETSCQETERMENVERRPKVIKPALKSPRNRSGSFHNVTLTQKDCAYRLRNLSSPTRKTHFTIWDPKDPTCHPQSPTPLRVPPLPLRVPPPTEDVPPPPLRVPLPTEDLPPPTEDVPPPPLRVPLPTEDLPPPPLRVPPPTEDVPLSRGDTLLPCCSSPNCIHTADVFSCNRIPLLKRRQNSLDVQFLHLMTVGCTTRPAAPAIHTSPSSPILKRVNLTRDDSTDSSNLDRDSHKLSQPIKVQKNSVDSGIEEYESSQIDKCGGKRASPPHPQPPSRRSSKCALHDQLFCTADCDELTAMKQECDEYLYRNSEGEGSRTPYSHSCSVEDTPSYLKDLGRSLLCGWQPEGYSPYPVLSGVSPTRDLYASICDELKGSRQTRLSSSPDAESVCIVADMQDWSVKVLSSNSDDYTLNDSKMNLPSSMVSRMVEGAKSLAHMTHAPEFCLSFLEDQLLEIYFKSESLMELLETSDDLVVQTDALSQLVDCQLSDIPLLLSVASIHSPSVINTLSIV